MKLSKEFIANFREEAKRALWEINSWNGKSIDDLVVDYLECKELKPEDFTGAVVLKLQVAELIVEHLRRVQKYLMRNNYEGMAQYSQLYAEWLEDAIEQAEMSK